MKNFAVLLFLLFIISVSCKNNKVQIVDSVSNKNIKYSEVIIDTVYVEIEDSSYSGFSGVTNNSLYFFDEYFSYYYPVSIDGRVGSRRMGAGGAPFEIPIRNALEVCFADENTFVTMGGTLDMYILKNMGDRKMIGMIAQGKKDSYNSSTAYTLWPEIIMRSDGKNLFYNVKGNNESVAVERNDYYQNARTLMKVDLNSGKMEPVGKYSDYYVANRNRVKHLPFVYFDVDAKGRFYVTHQADSLIYLYNRNFDLIKRLGFQGVSMNTNYSNPSYDLGRAYINDMREKGYYYWIKKVEEQDMMFRIYQKGSHSLNDGMQVYQGDDLVADVEVPKGFRVIGYVAPYFVTQIICDDDGETMKFYRFTLE